MKKIYNEREVRKRIEEALKEQHMSQVQFAEVLNVKPSTVNKYLSGELALSLKRTVQIADELGMDLNDLVYGEPKKIPGLDAALKYIKRAKWEIERLSK